MNAAAVAVGSTAQLPFSSFPHLLDFVLPEDSPAATFLCAPSVDLPDVLPYSGKFSRDKTFAFRYKTRNKRRKISRIAPIINNYYVRIAGLGAATHRIYIIQ